MPDSQVSTTEAIDERKTLFICAQIGQVKQAQAIAKRFGIVNVEIAILYTKRNLQMPRLMEADINPNIVARSHLVEIHVFSNDLSYMAVKYDRKKYQQLLDIVKPDRLFVCSFERHYAILLEEAKNREIPIALFEEGTAIFKVCVPGFSTFLPDTIKKSATNIYRRVWKDRPITRFVFRPAVLLATALVVGVREIIALPYLIGKTAYEIYKAPQIQRRILEKKAPKFVTGWYEFDELYASYPDVVAPHFNGARPITYHPSHSRPEDMAIAQKLVEQYRIDENTMLFTSQRFDVRPEKQIPAVLALVIEVARLNNYRVVAKLHPREDAKVLAIYRKTITAMGADDLITIIEGHHVPAETILANSKAPAVVAITSSTLMYAPNVRAGIRAISIGWQLVDDLQKMNINTDHLVDHNHLLDTLEHIEHFRAGEIHPSPKKHDPINMPDIPARAEP